MTPNDIVLVITWVAGIAGAIIYARNARKRIRKEAQEMLDVATFTGAQAVIDILKEQIDELRDELSKMRNQMIALRAREGKLWRRIGVLEHTLVKNGIVVPEEPVVSDGDI